MLRIIAIDTPLYFAALEVHIHVVKVLREEFNSNIIGCGLSNSKILHLACQLGYTDVIDELINNHHIDPMTRDCDQNTILHLAASFGQVETVKHLLVTYTFDIFACNTNNLTPLCLAAINGHYDVLQTLIDKFC